MKICYDCEVDALYLQFRRGKANKTYDYNNNIAIDVDEQERIIGIEILNASKVVDLKTFKNIIYRAIPAPPTSKQSSQTLQ